MLASSLGCMSVWTIVVAAGSGARFGGAKQFETLRGMRVIDRSLRTAAEVSDGVVVVLPELVDVVSIDGTPCLPAVGGDTRSASVRAGLALVPDDAEVILVHDAARPLATADLYRATIAAVREGADACVPAVAVADTIKRVVGTRVVETLDRSELVAVQTPQAFRAEVLRNVHTGLPDASDDAGLVEAAQGAVVVIEGLRENLKLTVFQDLRVMEALCAAEDEADHE